MATKLKKNFARVELTNFYLYKIDTMKEKMNSLLYICEEKKLKRQK